MRAALALAVLFGALAAGCGVEDPLARTKPPRPATESGRAHHFDVEKIATGLNRPTWVGTAPGDDALWVLEQPGRVVRIDGDERRTVMDLTGDVKLGAEQGLLGIAFHPDFATNHQLFLHWSDRNGDSRVAEFREGEDEPRRQLLFVDQPEENHNGGQLAFGPDGRLYLGLGDGGGAFDPRRSAQDPKNPLGKILAADVSSRKPEFEAVLTGLRNPWRFSFDAALGEIWIADVGQDHTEEVDRVLLELDEPPKNLGWSAYEGTQRVEDHELDRSGDLVWPVATYSHGDGDCSVTGGVVYTGSALQTMRRRYIYGDFCSGKIWTLKGTPDGRATDVRREQAVIPALTSIGTTEDGELLFASGNGALYRALPAGSKS